MAFSVDVWLRGDQHATTIPLDGLPPQPRQWTDDDVKGLLEGMLKAMDRLKRQGLSDRDVALRGLSWIVNPYEDGVVVAIEITLGAAVAGPFDIEQAALDAMIARVLKPQPPGSAAVH